MRQLDNFDELAQYQDYKASTKHITNAGEKLSSNEKMLVKNALELLPLAPEEREKLENVTKLELAELFSIIPLSEFPNAGVLRANNDFYLVNQNQLAKGGFGGVYKAFSSNLLRQVALKTLLNDTEDGRAMFKREGQAQANESHPNIISVFGYISEAKSSVAELNGKPIIVMEYLNPETNLRLDKYMPFKPKELKIISEQMFRALEFMYKPKMNRLRRAFDNWLKTEKGASLLHMDLKPENIFISLEGLLKLGDFGIASTVINQGDLRKSPMVSPHWASPERVMTMVPDIRSELFSYTSIIYFMMMGKPFFDSDIVDVDEKSHEKRKTDIVVKVIELEMVMTPEREQYCIEEDIRYTFVPEMAEYCQANGLSVEKVAEFFRVAWAKHPNNRYQTISEYRAAFMDAFTPVA